MITVYEQHASADKVYNLIRAIEQTYDDNKNTTAGSFNWALEKSGHPPYDDALAHAGKRSPAGRRSDLGTKSGSPGSVRSSQAERKRKLISTNGARRSGIKSKRLTWRPNGQSSGPNIAPRTSNDGIIDTRPPSIIAEGAKNVTVILTFFLDRQ